MEWTRSETLALASPSCSFCHGLGLWERPSVGEQPCNCVFRAIFRACYVRFRECVDREKDMSRLTLEPVKGRDRNKIWGRKNEEYSADFFLVSRRSLSASDFRLFRYHFLLGADWRLCCRKLNIDRGTFFHTVYRIEAKLGRVYRELQPYALFPLDEYFHGPVKPVGSSLEKIYNKVVPIRPPTKRHATRVSERKIA